MQKIFQIIAGNPKTVLAALVIAAVLGVRTWRKLPVDVFPDVSVPRVTIMTEAGGLSAEEVEQLVTIPVESAVNGVPGVTKIRSSSSGGLSFVWIDFEWDADVARARFDVFERLSRVSASLPAEAHAEIAPVVSVTGEIMLVALTAGEDGPSSLEIRELAEYDLRTRLMSVPGIGEVAVIGGRLPEYRVAADPLRLAQYGLSLGDVIDAARGTRTFSSAGYLADVAGDEVPLRQIARADTLVELCRAPVPLASGGSLRLGDVASVSVSGAPRRGSASFNGREAVVLSVQKAPGGNTPRITAELERTLADFASSSAASGIEVHSDAYRQADFIGASIKGGGEVVRDAVVVVVAVLLIMLLELRTILTVMCTMPLSILLGLVFFPMLGLGVDVMTLGGFAIAAGDIVDAAIIFTEVIRRKLGENAALEPGRRRPAAAVISEAAASVAPGVLFSTLTVVIVFVPLLMLSGLEGRFFRPLALSYIAVFGMSLAAAWTAVPALAAVFRLGGGAAKRRKRTVAPGMAVMQAVYRPVLGVAMRFPRSVLAAASAALAAALYIAGGFGSSFLPPFREDSFNVMVSLPPGASLAETERLSEACVPDLMSIPGVRSVTRRTGRAERDQHAEPVSSSEFVVRVDLEGDTEAVRAAIRERLGGIPGCAVAVGYPIAHRISAVLSGTEAELAVNIFGEDAAVLRRTAAAVKKELEAMDGVADIHANREITVRTLRIDYDMDALAEAGITPGEAGEQVSAAFNGAETGEVRNGIRRRPVTVRLAGDENAYGPETVKSLIISGRSGRRVRLDEIARVVPEEAAGMLLREGGRRKAMVSCNPAPGTDVGSLVAEMRSRLSPIAAAAGCSVSFGGSYEARESASRSLGVLGAGLLVLVFFVLVAALGSASSAFVALLNVPLAAVGSVAAVALAEPVLSVSSLVGFITVIGFTVRNGILLLNRYRELEESGIDAVDAIREGSVERMAPIMLTSLTTVIGLVPIMLSGDAPGGELLAPIAVVQFGGLVGAAALSLVVLPAAALLFGFGGARRRSATAAVAAFALAAAGAGCRGYEPAPIDWAAESDSFAAGEVRLASVADASALALAGNREINALRLEAANSAAAAVQYGWWEDPELGFDLMRIVNPSSHPFLGGGSLVFTLPLSGVPGCEAAAAEAISASRREEVLAAELGLSARARAAALKLAALHERRRILSDYDSDRKIVDARASAEKLHLAGEVGSTELSGMHRAVHARRHALMETELEIAGAEIAFLRLAGLRPGTKVEIGFRPELPSGGGCEAVDAVGLLSHPEVKAALARFEASEASLEAEVRRQYPELKFGPAYANEEGLDRLGIAAGLTLPLWNRNRKGIAEAEGRRAEARLAAIDVWRSLVCDAAAAEALLSGLRAHPAVPASGRREADTLFAAGELSPLEYLGVREEILDQELSEAEWRRDVALAAAELAKFRQ